MGNFCCCIKKEPLINDFIFENDEYLGKDYIYPLDQSIEINQSIETSLLRSYDF